MANNNKNMHPSVLHQEDQNNGVTGNQSSNFQVALHPPKNHSAALDPTKNCPATLSSTEKENVRPSALHQDPQNTGFPNNQSHNSRAPLYHSKSFPATLSSADHPATLSTKKENVNPSTVFQECQKDGATANTPPNFAIAFDIDGVLVRGKTPINTAASALGLLQANRIPYILLTNGGGLTEVAHAELLGERLGIDVDEDQFVQSHTPFKSFLHCYQDEWVLCLGGKMDTIKQLAVAYGFSKNKVVSSSDLVKMFPNLHPFGEMTTDHHLKYGTIIEDFIAAPKISAIFVFSSPRDWCLDLQLCLDLLASDQGRLFTRSALNGDSNLQNHGYQQDGQPHIYFCNPDLEWATTCSQPRLAQGAFRASLEGLWNNFTHGKAPLKSWTCGKPTHTTYDYAEHAIDTYRHKINTAGHNLPDLQTMYMIGDNPASDIAGAIAANEVSNKTWKSVLVETGIYKPDTTPEHTPTVVKANVLKAVKWIIEEEKTKKEKERS